MASMVHSASACFYSQFQQSKETIDPGPHWRQTHSARGRRGDQPCKPWADPTVRQSRSTGMETAARRLGTLGSRVCLCLSARSAQPHACFNSGFSNGASYSRRTIRAPHHDLCISGNVYWCSAVRWCICLIAEWAAGTCLSICAYGVNFVYCYLAEYICILLSC